MESAISAEGTTLHAYRANPNLDRQVLRPNQQDLLRISEENHAFVFDRVSQKFGISDSEPFEEGNEKELWVMRDGKPEISGHCDRWRRYTRLNLVVILDDKFGYKIVEPAAANLQLRTYAVGAVDEWPDTLNVAVAIVQPRLSYELRTTIAHYERSDIDASRAELFSILDASREPDAPLNAGETQCRYCLARLLCPAFAAKFQDGIALVPVDTTGTVAKRTDSIERSLAECTDEQLDRILVALQMADFVKDQARDEARRRVEAGGMDNWQLGKAQMMRDVVDSKRAIGLLTLRGVVTRDEALECAHLGIGKLEEKVRAKTKCTWQEAKEIVEETIGSVIEREPKKLSLTRKKI